MLVCLGFSGRSLCGGGGLLKFVWSQGWGHKLFTGVCELQGEESWKGEKSVGRVTGDYCSLGYRGRSLMWAGSGGDFRSL